MFKSSTRNFLTKFYKTISFQTCSASKLCYTEFGEPIKVLKKVEDCIPNLKPYEVLVKMLASPVNPADINTIQGKYPHKPTFPAIPGNEGVGEIMEIGSEVCTLCVGDRVVPLQHFIGTWRTHLVLKASSLFKVPKNLELGEAATLTVNPCTAYRMLKDFVDLEEGDVVIQNGANSACGQNIIQLARIWNICTVNIVRDRPNIEDLVNHLKCLGATEVLTEEQLRATDIFKSGTMKKPKLAINCVGGKSATELMRHLENCGTIVTYGGMSREPVVVATSALIFKDLRVLGYWMTEWVKRHAASPERFEMLEELIKYMCEGKLVAPNYKMVDFEDYEEAIENSLTDKGKTGLKYILRFCDT